MIFYKRPRFINNSNTQKINFDKSTALNIYELYICQFPFATNHFNIVRNQILPF